MNDNIHSNVMLVDLRISQWTARKQDKRVSKKVADSNHVDQRVGAYYKSLLDPAIIDGIKKLVNEARTYHYRVTLPWSDDGPRVLPSTLYFEYTRQMQDYRQRFVSEVEALLSEYPYHREEAKRFLGSLFDEDDYPTPDKLSEKYAFNLRFTPLPRGADFRCNIPDDELDELRKEIEQQSEATMQRAVEDAYRRVQQVVERYVERLAKPNGVFRDSMVEGARDLVALLPALNVTGDERLAAITDRLEKDLIQYDPQALRTNTGAREHAYETAKTVASDVASVFGG